MIENGTNLILSVSSLHYLYFGIEEAGLQFYWLFEKYNKNMRERLHNYSHNNDAIKEQKMSLCCLELRSYH